MRWRRKRNIKLDLTETFQLCGLDWTGSGQKIYTNLINSSYDQKRNNFWKGSQLIGMVGHNEMTHTMLKQVRVYVFTLFTRQCAAMAVKSVYSTVAVQHQHTAKCCTFPAPDCTDTGNVYSTKTYRRDFKISICVFQ